MFHAVFGFEPLHEEHARLLCSPEIAATRWARGKPLRQGAARDEAPPDAPVALLVSPERPGLLPEFSVHPVPLMTRRLLAALRAAGVDNLEVYDAEITDTETGEVDREHVAFNLIGLVAAADMDASSFNEALEERLISVDFHSLVVDEAAAQGLLMFRVAQCVTAILVHDRVKRAVEASGIDTLTFLPPEDCAF